MICIVIVTNRIRNYYITIIILMSGIEFIILIIVLLTISPCAWVIISTVSDFNLILTN